LQGFTRFYDITKEFGIKRLVFMDYLINPVSTGLKGKTITCHLGAGSSISALIDGKPVDTAWDSLLQKA